MFHNKLAMFRWNISTLSSDQNLKSNIDSFYKTTWCHIQEGSKLLLTDAKVSISQGNESLSSTKVPNFFQQLFYYRLLKRDPLLWGYSVSDIPSWLLHMNEYSDVCSLAEQAVRDARPLHSGMSCAGPTFLQQCSLRGQRALKVWRTWIDTVDFQPPILIPNGPQKKGKKKELQFFPFWWAEWSYMEKTDWQTGVMELWTFKKRYCHENGSAYPLQTSICVFDRYRLANLKQVPLEWLPSA
jgi:hypothetical protein